MQGNWRKSGGLFDQISFGNGPVLNYHKIYVITGKTECEEVMLSCWRAH